MESIKVNRCYKPDNFGSVMKPLMMILGAETGNCFHKRAVFIDLLF